MQEKLPPAFLSKGTEQSTSLESLLSFQKAVSLPAHVSVTLHIPVVLPFVNQLKEHGSVPVEARGEKL